MVVWRRQVQDVRYNVQFTPNYTEVAYDFYEFQTYKPELSCRNCSLNDSFVGINRYAPLPTAAASRTHAQAYVLERICRVAASGQCRSRSVPQFEV